LRNKVNSQQSIIRCTEEKAEQMVGTLTGILSENNIVSSSPAKVENKENIEVQ